MDIKQIKITTQRAIPLGYQGENAVVQISFPQPESLLSERWTLMHQRATDSEAYPVPLNVVDGGLVWTVSSGDAAVSGLGRAQLICTGADGEILKTMVYGTVTAKSLAVGGEVPDPVKPWYDAIIEEIEQIGGIDPEDIKAAVEAYMAENPVAETDPTVPDWAKQPEKPTYTAEEVGALPATYTPPEAPVQSVNGKTGAVTLTAEDVGALPDSCVPPEAAPKAMHIKIPSQGDPDHTFAEIYAHYLAGGYTDLYYHSNIYILRSCDESAVTFSNTNASSGSATTAVVEITKKDSWSLMESKLAPVYLINGKTGNVTLDIPTDDHITDLINTALGVIENGTY